MLETKDEGRSRFAAAFDELITPVCDSLLVVFILIGAIIVSGGGTMLLFEYGKRLDWMDDVFLVVCCGTMSWFIWRVVKCFRAVRATALAHSES